MEEVATKASAGSAALSCAAAWLPLLDALYPEAFCSSMLKQGEDKRVAVMHMFERYPRDDGRWAKIASLVTDAVNEWTLRQTGAMAVKRALPVDTTDGDARVHRALGALAVMSTPRLSALIQCLRETSFLGEAHVMPTYFSLIP